MEISEIKESLLLLFGEDILNDNNFIILYGSLNFKNDIDLFLITNNNTIPNISVGKFDFLSKSKESFEYLLKFFEPIVIEPLFTGQLLFGNKGKWFEIIEKTKRFTVSDKIIRYLSRRCLETLLSSETYLDYYIDTPNNLFLLYSFKNLSFSISYASFSNYYSESNGHPIILKQLRERQKLLLKDFWIYRDKIKSKELKLNFNDLISWTKVWRTKLVAVQ